MRIAWRTIGAIAGRVVADAAEWIADTALAACENAILCLDRGSGGPVVAHRRTRVGMGGCLLVRDDQARRRRMDTLAR